MSRLPYFPLYPGDVLSDPRVLAMNISEFGLHMRCLLVAWAGEGIPADPAKLARMVGITAKQLEKAWPALQELWLDGPEGRLVNPRQERERQEASAKHERRVAAGRKGGKARASKNHWGVEQ